MADIWLLVFSSIVGAITLMAVGGNDVANSQATAVGSGALSLKGAYILAGLCEFLGSSLMGNNVSATLGNEFIDRDHAHISDNEYCWGMFCSLISAAIWIFICTKLKMPVSTTHSIIGALVGFELIASNWKPKYLNWFIIAQVVMAWIASPLMGLLLAYLFMLILNKFWVDINAKLRTLSMPLLEQETQQNKDNLNNTTGGTGVDVYDGTGGIGGVSSAPEESGIKSTNKNDTNFPPRPPPNDNNNNNNGDTDGITMGNGYGATDIGGDNSDNIVDDVLVVDKPKAKKFGLLFGFVFTVIMLFIFVGGPPAVRITEMVEWWAIILIAIGIFMLSTIFGYFMEKPYHRYYYRQNHSFMTEDYFILFLVIASGAVSFAHGGNDVANVIGPFGAIYSFYQHGDLDHNFSVPIWLSMIGGFCIVIGFILFGKSVMETIGTKITILTYRTGFAAQFASACTVLVCNVFGIPVSSTTVIVGAVAGVGIYQKESPSERRDTIAMSGDYNRKSKQSVAEVTTKNLKYFIEKLKKMNYKVLGKILLTWIVTIPSNAILCMVTFGLYKWSNTF